MSILENIFNWIHKFELFDIIYILLLLVIGIHFLYFIANKKKISFLYRNSVAWLIQRNLFYFFTVILLVLPKISNSEVLFAIATSYIVSFFFYEITSVNDKISSDRESLKQIKTIAYCKTAFEGMHFEIINMPCNPGDSINLNIENCKFKCSWNKLGRCVYYKELIYNIQFLKRRINSSMVIISVCKPELIRLFSIVQGCIVKAAFCLDNNRIFHTCIFKEIDEAHNFFTREGDSGSKNIYSDADMLEKNYRKFYADCLREIKIGKPSSILDL